MSIARPLVAIDFGTSNSSAAVVVEGRIVPIKDPATHSYSFPSSVCRDGDALVIGTAAEKRRRTCPAGYRTEFKRVLGQDVPIDLAGQSYPVVNLVAAMLNTLRELAEQVANQAVRFAVVTVPADYGPAQRGLMATAADRAGFTGAVTVLDEPVAAAYAPAHGARPGPGELMLVYDFGGGTFDAAILKAGDRDAAEEFEVLKDPLGLPDCGGGDIDALIYTQLRTAAGAALADLLSIDHETDPRQRTIVLQRRQEFMDFVRTHVKHQLSMAEHANDVFTAGPVQVPVELDRAQFDRIVEPVIERTIGCCRELLHRVGHQPIDLAAILLVGGSTRMPVVADSLRRAFARPLRRTEDPELAVAVGAAHWALSHPGQVQPAARAGRVIQAPIGLTALAVTEIHGIPMAIAGGTDGVLFSWSLDDGAAGPSVRAHHGTVTSLDIVSDGAVASGGRDGAVRLWQPATDAEPRTLYWHDGWVNAVHGCPDGVFSVGDDGHLRWATLDHAGAAGQRWISNQRAVGCTRLTDGSFAVALADGSIGWHSPHAPPPEIPAAAARVAALAFDEASGLLVLASTDGTLRWWRPPLAEPVAEHPAGPGAVRDLRVGPSGLLASAHADGSVRLWHPERPDQPGTIGTHEGPVRAVAFCGVDLLVSAGADNNLRLWRLEPDSARPKPGGISCRPQH